MRPVISVQNRPRPRRKHNFCADPPQASSQAQQTLKMAVVDFYSLLICLSMPLNSSVLQCGHFCLCILANETHAGLWQTKTNPQATWLSFEK